MMPRGTTASSTSDGRDFNCSICNRSFARLEHLQRHTRTHTKEKPFLCFCGKTFTRNDLLKRHKLRSHLPEDKAPESQSLVNPDIAREGGFSQTTTESQLLSDHGQNHAEIQDSFHDFSVFLDGIGLAPAWDSLDFFDLETTQDDNESSDQHNSMLVVGGPMTHHDHVSSQAQDAQVINLEAVGQLVNAELVRQAPDPIKWKLSQSQWDELARKIEECGPVLAGFVLPSRHAMSRYFQSYVDQFHQHYPIVHIASYLAEIPPICLTLVIAAIGAQYRFESRNGQPLYEAAKALLLLDRQKDSRYRGNELSSERRIVVIQGLVLLMAYGAWDWQTELFKGALDLQSILAGYMRELLEETPQTHAGESEWQRWLHEESRNRALLLAFAYLNVQSITFDLPPVILSSTIQHLALPSNADMWDAKTAHEWHILRSSAHSQVSVADAMHYLFCDEASQETQRSMRSSAIGSFIVLQALIQRITLLWQFETADHQLPPQDHARLQRALSRWKAIWQRSPDSTLDPRHAEGPVPFTSAAFLALAYARLHINIGPCHKLSSRTPEIIATALLSTPVPQCGPEIVPALLHAAHALNVPVTMGVDYASKSQIFFWNCQHSLCGLESGVFLWRWLQAAEEYTEADLNTDEKNIICWVRTSVSETLQSIGAEELGFREDVDVMSLTFPKLGVIVLRIWARIFSGNTMWAFTHEIGASLRLLADMVDR